VFAYILYAPSTPRTEETDEFFRRFTETPGLLYAFDLMVDGDQNDGAVVAVWDSRESAERYLNQAPLRKEVDEAIPQIRRVMYEVIGTN
jgi:heme-degrading monooxygenase HmoA